MQQNNEESPPTSPQKTRVKKERKKTDFKQFFEELKQEFLETDIFTTKEPTEEQARKIFELVHDKDGYPNFDRDDDDDDEDAEEWKGPWNDETAKEKIKKLAAKAIEGEMVEDIVKEATESSYHTTGQDESSAWAETGGTSMEMAPKQTGLQTVELPFTQMPQSDGQYSTGEVENVDDDEGQYLRPPGFAAKPEERIESRKHERSPRKSSPPSVPPGEEDLAAIRELLPMFSDQRLKRILGVFRGELGDPSMLDLVLAVRERMPDYLTNEWLKKMSGLTASYLMAEAEQRDIVDSRFLTSILAMMASCGRINDALHFHQTEFQERNMEPTAHSDRLVFQMFLNQNRFARAMSFKQKLGFQSRTLDLVSYGALVQFCADRKQVGSALMFIRECINVHGTHPDEPSLKKLRYLCNQIGIDDHPDVLSMIGQDPMYWHKIYGAEAKLTRHHKKGMTAHKIMKVRNKLMGG